MLNKTQKVVFLAVLPILFAGATVKAQERVVPSAQAVNAARSIYDRKYGNCEEALRRVFGSAKIAPSQQVSAGNVSIAPAPAVKHCAEVDQPVQGGGEAMVRYLNNHNHPKNGNVNKWYKDNFGL